MFKGGTKRVANVEGRNEVRVANVEGRNEASGKC